MTDSSLPPSSDPGARAATSLRPAEFARLALASVGASEGRRRRRQRDTLADSLGLDLKLALLQAVAAADPDSEEFERFLLEYALTADGPSGPIRGVCSDVWLEWESASIAPSFVEWLRGGARERGEEARSPGRAGARESFRPDRGPDQAATAGEARPRRRDRFEWELRGVPPAATGSWVKADDAGPASEADHHAGEEPALGGE